MTRASLQNTSVAQLVEQFERIALAQDAALLGFRTATYNRLYDSIENVLRELRSRPGDERRALGQLLRSSNAQVRLKAAISVLPFFPKAARRALEELYADKIALQCADAGLILRGLDDGSFVPE